MTDANRQSGYDISGHRFDLLVDAILATSIRSQDNIPFLYAFLDFLKMSLNSPAHISLASSQVHLDFFVSSNPIRHCREHPGLTPTFQWDIDSKLIFSIEPLDQRGVHDTVKDLNIFLSHFHDHCQTDVFEITKRLHQALKTLHLGFLRKDFSSSPQQEKIPPHDKHKTETLIKESLNNLSKYFHSDFDDSFVVIRYFVHPNWEMKILAVTPNGRDTKQIVLEGLPNDIHDPVSASFETGFIQIQPLNNQSYILCVPCHLGGEPWLVFCLNLEKWPNDWWKAYTYYRDYISKIFEELRLSSLPILAAEMLRLLKLSREKTTNRPEDTVSHINEYWAELGQIFPLLSPRLVPLSNEVKKKQDGHFLTINNEQWYIDSSASPKYMSRFQLKAAEDKPIDKGELWASSEEMKKMFRQVFLNPAIAYLEYDNIRQRIEKYRDIAVGSYKIGHPMKRRVGSIQKAIGSLIYGLEHDSSIEQLKSLANKASERLEHIENLGHILDVISRALTKEKYEKTFLSDGKEEYWVSADNYLICPRVNTISSQINNAETVKGKDGIQLNWGADANTAFIAPWLNEQTVRPSDLFYDEIFWEILFNAFRRGKANTNQQVSIRVFLEPISNDRIESSPMLVFENDCEYGINAQSLLLDINNGWNKWSTSENAPVGGLYFIATFLQITNTGCLYAKIHEIDKRFTFSIGLLLNGIRLKTKGLNNDL